MSRRDILLDQQVPPEETGEDTDRVLREDTADQDLETSGTPWTSHTSGPAAPPQPQLSPRCSEEQDTLNALPSPMLALGKRLHGSGSFDSLVSGVSTQSGGSGNVLRCGGRHVEDCSFEDILIDVRTHLEVTCDVLAAEQLLEALKSRLGKDWAEIEDSELILCFRHKIQLFHDIGTTLCMEVDGWFSAWKDAEGGLVECAFDPSDRQLLRYRIRCPIAGRISSAVAIFKEQDLLSHWNPSLRAPEVFGKETPHYVPALRYQTSLFRGLLKLDVLSEVWRFVDHEAGFIAESSVPLTRDSQYYLEPAAGHRRPMEQQRRAWVAIGEDACLLVQAGSVRLPAGIGRRLITLLVSYLVGHLLQLVRKSTLRAATPGSPWEPRLKEDKEGLYCALDRLAASELSKQRAIEGREPRHVDVASLFARRPGLVGRLKRLTYAGKKPRKVVGIAPALSYHSIPDHRGQKEMYQFLAEQHGNLERALQSDRSVRPSKGRSCDNNNDDLATDGCEQ